MTRTVAPVQFRRTLSGKHVAADRPKLTWQDLVHPAPKAAPAPAVHIVDLSKPEQPEVDAAEAARRKRSDAAKKAAATRARNKAAALANA